MFKFVFLILIFPLSLFASRNGVVQAKQITSQIMLTEKILQSKLSQRSGVKADLEEISANLKLISSVAGKEKLENLLKRKNQLLQSLKYLDEDIDSLSKNRDILVEKKKSISVNENF